MANSMAKVGNIMVEAVEIGRNIRALATEAGRA